MKEEKKHIIYSAADIKKYLSGKMSYADMYALEKAALDDPFLAEAIEGYEAANETKSENALLQLKERFLKKEDDSVIPFSAFKWWKAAAAILIVASTVGITYLVTNKLQNKTTIVADAAMQKEPAEHSEILPDSISANIPKTEASTSLKKETSLETEKQEVISLPVISSLRDSTFIYRPTDAIASKADHTKADFFNERKKEQDFSTTPVQVSPANTEGLNAAAITDKSLSNQNKYNNNQGASNNNINNANIQNELAVEKGKQAREIEDERTDDSKKIPAQQNELVVINAAAAKKKSITSNTFPTSAADIQPEGKTAGTAIRNRAIPVFGWDNYINYLAKNNQLPDSLKSLYKGKFTILDFKVKKNGRISQLKVKQSACKACDQEAIRLLKEGPAWKTTNNNTSTGSITVTF